MAISIHFRCAFPHSSICRQATSFQFSIGYGEEYQVIRHLLDLVVYHTRQIVDLEALAIRHHLISLCDVVHFLVDYSTVLVLICRWKFIS